MKYKVSWVIDIEARSAVAAAREALAIQRKPDSIATVFEVKAEGKSKSVPVDLTEIDECLSRRKVSGPREGRRGARGANTPQAVTLVMEVLPCRGSEGDYPQWAEIKVDPQLLEHLVKLHTVCRRDGLASVSVDMALDRWDDLNGEFSVYREHLVVTQREFCFAARRDIDGMYADYDVETLDIASGEFLAAIGRKGKLPEGWARKGGTLFVASTKDHLGYLRESYAEAKKASKASS